MSEWVRRWKITTLYERRPGHGDPTRRVNIVDTVAELRAAVAAARADPECWHVTYESIRMTVGDRPTRCPRGHDLRGGTATRARQDWLPCSCGGHLLYVCGWCQAVAVDPPPSVDCDPEPKDGQTLPAVFRG